MSEGVDKSWVIHKLKALSGLSSSIDGGAADSIYLPTQNIDGGTASTSPTGTIDGGDAGSF